MAKISKKSSFRDYQDFVRIVYGISNDRNFSSWDMLSNVQRFIMRGLKGIRKKDSMRVEDNLLIAMSWLMSLMNQHHIDVEQEIWLRFPGVCSYCGFSPCRCRDKKNTGRKNTKSKTPQKHPNIMEYQQMFEKIYPSSGRTLEDAGIHLAEEMGELSEAYLVFKGSHREKDFELMKNETADLISCFMAVFNSLDKKMADGLSKMFSNNCHVCKQAPCKCSFDFVVKYKS